MSAVHGLAQSIADENDNVSIQTPELEIEFSLRDPDLVRYEGSDSGSLYLRVPSMADGVYVEVVPTVDGIVPSVVETVQEELTRIDVAERDTSTDVDAVGTRTYVYD